MQETITLLEKELTSMTKARDGILEAYKIIKKNENVEDTHLKDLYTKFDNTVKSHQQSMVVIMDSINKANAAGSVGK